MSATKQRAESKDGFWETVKVIVEALLLALVVRTFLFQPFSIPSGSMMHTLLIGDYLFVSKYSYGYSKYSFPFGLAPFEGRVWASAPKAGDIVVFKLPADHSTDYIKRVIGLPGDKIQMQGGVVYINGVAAPQEPAGTFSEIYEPQGPMRNLPQCENGAVGAGGTCTKSRFIETLPEGQKHSVLNIRDNGPGDDTQVLTVPEGHYFFMGDNRDNSTDSRYDPRAGGVGMLPAEYLIGRADRVIFSSAGSRMLYFWTWRSDRFFKAIE